MKRLLAAAIAAAVGSVTLVGCEKGSPGGTGTTAASGKTIVGTAEQTFSLDVPNLSTSLKQGESKVVTIKIRRGKNFDQDVALKLDNLPKGVTADPSAPTIKKSEEEVKVTLKAADDAALGDATVKVVGHPGTGSDATSEMKISVEKK